MNIKLFISLLMHKLLTFCCFFILPSPHLPVSCFFLSKQGIGVLSLCFLLQASAMPGNMPEFSWVFGGIFSWGDPFFWTQMTGRSPELPSVTHLINAGPEHLWKLKELPLFITWAHDIPGVSITALLSKRRGNCMERVLGFLQYKLQTT